MLRWDLDILHHINQQWGHPLLDWLMPALSAIDSWMPLIIVGALVIAWRGGKKARLMLLCIGLSIWIGDGLISNGLKKSIGRVRPRDAVEGIIIRDLAPGSPDITRLFKP